MRRTYSLATRTFVLTFLAGCAALATGLLALNTALKARIKEGLKENLKLSEQQLDERESEYDRSATRLIATLSENAGLKAAIGLGREQTTSASRAQVRATVEDQLRDMSRGLDFDLFMVMDTEGSVIATYGARVDDDQARKAYARRSSGPWLVRAGHDLYKVTSVPINLGSENLGTLAVGRRFVLVLPGAYGFVVLTDSTGIVASTLPAASNAEVQRQLLHRCVRLEDGCEIAAGGQDYLALRVGRDWVTPDYQLLRLASINDAMRGFTRGLRRVFVLTGIGAVLMAGLFSLLASRSISRPLAQLASDLEVSGETGALWNDFGVNSSTREVNLLADALNRTARTRRQVESELRNAKESAEAATNQVKVSYDETLEALGAALDLRDNETAGHSHRVTRYSLELAIRMGCSGEQLKQIERGAYLHDIGKIGSPDAILLKPGRLTADEREIMQRHARIGYELVSRIEFLREAAEVVYTHQERYDGMGYPQGLRGDAIPLGARIFAVADTFDAMTSDRPYRKALSLEVALEEIRNESGHQFDPKVVDALNTIAPAVWDRIRRDVAGLGGSVASPRADLETTVTCKTLTTRFKSSSLNISESGMLLRSLGSIEVGEEIELEFYLPEVLEPLNPRVRVIRKESRGMGVRFITLTLEARNHIRRFTGSAVKTVVAT